MAAVAVAGPAKAQLSPGPLSRAHEDLDGLRNCGKCHALGNREVSGNCLECHEEIAAMRSGGKGLHAGDDYGKCNQCHVEHQGRDYELVYWPEGIEGFDHTVTGFALTGKHAARKCRDCHTTKHVQDPGALKSQGKDPNRTFLGLTAHCQACHQDPHAGQFKQDCTSCHDTRDWKQTPLFDHASTAYPLTGRHAKVACAACHKPVPEGQAVVFKGLPFANCTDCHKDPHANALGPRCTDCHVTDGWKLIQGKGFDHDKTRYPLRGLHAKVTCGGCHQERGPKPPFAACRDCHKDEHGGAARGRPGWSACERCHTVDGYRPARFTLADHDTTTYPLRGAHRATPCALCHRPQKPAPASAVKVDLAPPATACTDCHRDPHRWRAQTPPACTVCHAVATWRGPVYAHEQTRFPLTGRHEAVTCVACHKAPEGAEPPAPAFGGEPTVCTGCHQDVHKDTMTRTAAETAGVDCARCHVTRDWLAEKFDHDRDSRFTLKGGHAQVVCRACHKAPAGEPLVVFRPVATECVACHAVVPATQEEIR